MTSQPGRAYPTWEHSDWLPLTPGLSGLIRDPSEWPEHCGCEQGDTVKARPPGDPKGPIDRVGGAGFLDSGPRKGTGSVRNKTSAHLLSPAEQVPRERPQLSRYPAAPSLAADGFLCQKQNLPSLARLTGPPQLPGQALLPCSLLPPPPCLLQAAGRAGTRAGVDRRDRRLGHGTHQFVGRLG